LAVLEIPDEFTERRSARATMGRGRRFLLALYVVADTIETLIEAAPAETSWLGIGLRAGMLVICRGLGPSSSASPKSWLSRRQGIEGTG
jgi:hypothetical protein